jgi:hypothetical protein
VSGSFAGFRRSPLLCVGVVCVELLFGNRANSNQTTLRSPDRFAVDGLALGDKVRTDSATYKQYECTASSRYRDLTFCKRLKTEAKGGSNLTTTTTILRSVDGTVAYVNQFIEPASFSRSDIDAEIARLSTKYGENPRILEAPRRPGLSQAVMAIWGSLKLVELPETDIAILRSDRSPGKGILVDYLGDFTRSAQVGIPVLQYSGVDRLKQNAAPTRLVYLQMLPNRDLC